MRLWPKRRTLVELLTERLDQRDPMRVSSIDLRVHLVPIEHRHMN